MVKRFGLLLLLISSFALLARSSWPRVDQLIKDPEERRAVLSTIQKIEAGGPFPYPRDGIVFSNRERRLPSHPRGYYHEYTVPTRGAHNRGARRIIRGQQAETFYTRDHYETFLRLDQ